MGSGASSLTNLVFVIRFEEVHVADVHWYASGEDNAVGDVFAEHNRIAGQDRRKG